MLLKETELNAGFAPACLQSIMSRIKPGWNIIIIARKPIVQANFQQLNNAIIDVLNKADLLLDNNGN